MNTILKSGYWKIIKLFYENKNQGIHLREISRKTGIYVPSVSKFLKKLEDENILKAEKDGNLKKYYAKNNSNTNTMFQLFDIEKYEKLLSIRKTAITRFLENMDEKPVFVLLFGSTAKGNHKEESDIDILIVLNRQINLEKAEKETEAITGLRINSFRITYEKFTKELKLKEDNVVQAAITTGFPLMNHLMYYELTRNEHKNTSRTT